jgi:DeoR family transcriptional regulator, glycerol-3-phosphate regulon repressor
LSLDKSHHPGDGTLFSFTGGELGEQVPTIGVAVITPAYVEVGVTSAHTILSEASKINVVLCEKIYYFSTNLTFNLNFCVKNPKTVMISNKISKRHTALLGLVRLRGQIEVGESAKELQVSEETIRRDAHLLEERGEIIKLHGALTLPHQVGEEPLERRMRENAEAKRLIARAAAEVVKDGDSLIIDSGTTTSMFAQELRSKRRLTVVTNSSDIARTLATVNGNTVYMAGGELMGDSGAAYGPSAIEFISRFHVKHTFISIGALDAKSGPMDATLAEAQFGYRALTCAENRIVLTDATKFERTSLVRVCKFDELSEVISDKIPPPDLHATLLHHRVRITVA